MHFAQYLYRRRVMFPLVGLEIKNYPAGELPAERAVRQVFVELTAHPNRAVCTPQMIAVGMTAITFGRLQRAGITVKAARSQRHLSLLPCLMGRA